MNRFEYANATSVAEALALLKEPGVVAKAGGVDLLDRMKEGLISPARLLHIGTIKGLDYIKEDGEGLRIGALANMAAIERSAAVQARYGALASAAGHVATPQIRSVATLGGNLVQRPRCWYLRSMDFNCRKKGGEVCFAQTGENQFHSLIGNQLCAAIHPSTPATALIAYGAKVVISGPGGDRELMMDDFFTAPEADVTRENQLQPGELITELRIPAPGKDTRAAYHKQGEKESFDWPIADCAVVLKMNGEACKSASIVLGAIAPVPHRAKSAEAVLAGKTVGAQSALEAARAALAGVTPMTMNHYKVPVFEAVICRTILAAARGAA